MLASEPTAPLNEKTRDRGLRLLAALQVNVTAPTARPTSRWNGILWLMWTLVTLVCPFAVALLWIHIAAKQTKKRPMAEAILAILQPFAMLAALTGMMLAYLVVFGFADEANLQTLSWTWDSDFLAQVALSGMLVALVAMYCMGILSGQRAWKYRHAQTVAANEDEFRWKDFFASVFLWFTTGWMGGHRFYARRGMTGLLYAATFGLGGIGWAFDWFKLAQLCVDNQQDANAAKLASWADEMRELRWYDVVQRVIVYFVTPSLCVVLCVCSDHLELLGVLLVIMVVGGLLGNIDEIIRKSGMLQSIPFFKMGFEILKNLDRYYANQRPRSLLFYAVYPLSAPIGAFWSAAIRHEAKLYLKIVGGILLVPLFKYATSFKSTFQHIDKSQMLTHVGFHLAVILVVSTFLVLPVVTTSYKLRLAGRDRRLKLLAIAGLALAIPVGGVTYFWQHQVIGVTPTSRKLLTLRMQSDDFRGELETAAEMFLRHYQITGMPLHSRADRYLDVGDESVHTHHLLTERFRKHLSGFVCPEEQRAFRVFSLEENAGGFHFENGTLVHPKTHRWLGILHGAGTERSGILCLIGPEGDVHTSLHSRSWQQRDTASSPALYVSLADVRRMAERSAYVTAEAPAVMRR